MQALCKLTQSLGAHKCIDLVDLESLVVLHPIWILDSFLLLFLMLLSPEDRVLVETSHLGLRVPRSLTLYIA